MAKRKPSQRQAGRDSSQRLRVPATPEEAARTVTAHEPSAGPTGDKVKLALMLHLSRQQAERLTARAIREGKNLDALVAEILEAVPPGPAD